MAFRKARSQIKLASITASQLWQQKEDGQPRRRRKFRRSRKAVKIPDQSSSWLQTLLPRQSITKSKRNRNQSSKRALSPLNSHSLPLHHQLPLVSCPRKRPKLLQTWILLPSQLQSPLPRLKLSGKVTRAKSWGCHRFRLAVRRSQRPKVLKKRNRRKPLLLVKASRSCHLSLRIRWTPMMP